MVVYDSQTFERTAVYSLADVSIAGQPIPQRELFVFHDSAGARRFLISTASGEPDPAVPNQLSTF